MSDAKALLEELARRVPEMGARRDELLAVAEHQVTRWLWARDESSFHRPEPLFRERFGVRAPKWLHEPPSELSRVEAYGLDARGSVVLAREYMSPEVYFWEVFVHAPGTIDSWRYRSDGTPVETSRYVFGPDGTLRLLVTAGPHGARNEEHYEWLDGRLIAIRTDQDSGAEDRARVVNTTVQRVTYTSEGLVNEITEDFADGRKLVLFRARSDRDISHVRKDIQRRLVEVTRTITMSLGDEPTRIALLYERDDPLPPSLAIAMGLDGEPSVLWNPAEWEGPLIDLGHVDRPLLEACQLLRALTPDSDERRVQGRDVLVDACKALRRHVAPSAVVYPVDLELEDLRENLRLVLPPQRARELLAAGSLGPF